MTLADNALTDLSTALDELGLTSDGSTQDARIERYINVASDLFASLCGRNFHRESAHVEYAPSSGGVYLMVHEHLPITSISSIVWDNKDGSTTTVDSTEYGVSDAAAGLIERERGVWSSSEVYRRDVELHPTGRRVGRYKVTYTGGYITPKQATAGVGTRDLPYDIEDAVLQYVVMRWRQKGQDRSIASKTVGPASVTYNGHTVPPSFAETVQRYKRRAIG